MAAFFFGMMKTIAAAYSGIPVLMDLGLPDTVYKIIPYVATIAVLMFTSKNSKSPAASGVRSPAKINALIGLEDAHKSCNDFTCIPTAKEL